MDYLASKLTIPVLLSSLIMGSFFMCIVSTCVFIQTWYTCKHGPLQYVCIETTIIFVFHSNSLDADKQMAINVFLVVFQPQEGEKNVWELSTDYYLHHTLARVLPQTHSTSSHTKWWDDKLLNTLPLPLYGGGWGVCVCVCVCE